MIFPSTVQSYGVKNLSIIERLDLSKRRLEPHYAKRRLAVFKGLYPKADETIRYSECYLCGDGLRYSSDISENPVWSEGHLC